MNDALHEKYSRQILFAGIAEQGQQRLLTSSAVIVGCGAIGAATANLLTRAGVGKLRVIDRDFVEPSNLQRQTLFDESDALAALPKAVAAERKLRSINSGVLFWCKNARADCFHPNVVLAIKSGKEQKCFKMSSPGFS